MATSLDPLTRDPAAASARLIESAIELARAEAKLALTHARGLVTRAVVAILAVLIAMSFAHAALVSIALSPLLIAANHPLALVLALGPSLIFTAIAGFIAYRTIKNLDPTVSRSVPPPRET
jgi:hypothetical protein